MTMISFKVFLLTIYIGGQTGYMTVPDLPSEGDCHKLYTDITKVEKLELYRKPAYECISYNKMTFKMEGAK